MSERRVVEVSRDFSPSSWLTGYSIGGVIGIPTSIYIRDASPRKGDLIVVEDDLVHCEMSFGGKIPHGYVTKRVFKLAEEDDE